MMKKENDIYKSFGMTLREKRELQGIEHGPQSPGPNGPKTKHEGWIFALQPPDRTGGVPGFNLNPESPVRVYAVLERGSLVLYPGKPSHVVRSAEQSGQESISDKLKVIVLSRGCILQRLNPGDAKGNQFAFFVSDGRRAIILIAESEEREMAWIRKIEASAEESKLGKRGSNKAAEAEPCSQGQGPSVAVSSPGAGVGNLFGQGGRVLNGRFFQDEEEEDEGILDAAAALDAVGVHQRPSAPSMTPSIDETWHVGGRSQEQHHPLASASLGAAGMPRPTAPSLHRLGGDACEAAQSTEEFGMVGNKVAACTGRGAHQQQPGWGVGAGEKGVCGVDGKEDEDEDEELAAAVMESLRHATRVRDGCPWDKAGRCHGSSCRSKNEDNYDEEEAMLQTALRESAILSEAVAGAPAHEDENEQDAANLEAALIASQSRVEQVPVDQGSVARLEGMGFERSLVVDTLVLTGGDCQAAIDILLT